MGGSADSGADGDPAAAALALAAECSAAFALASNCAAPLAGPGSQQQPPGSAAQGAQQHAPAPPEQHLPQQCLPTPPLGLPPASPVRSRLGRTGTDAAGAEGCSSSGNLAALGAVSEAVASGRLGSSSGGAGPAAGAGAGPLRAALAARSSTGGPSALLARAAAGASLSGGSEHISGGGDGDSAVHSGGSGGGGDPPSGGGGGTFLPPPVLVLPRGGESPGSLSFSGLEGGGAGPGQLLHVHCVTLNMGGARPPLPLPPALLGLGVAQRRAEGSADGGESGGGGPDLLAIATQVGLVQGLGLRVEG